MKSHIPDIGGDVKVASSEVTVAITKREELLALAARSRPTGRLAQATLLASAGVAGGAGHVSSSPAALREAETLEEC